MTLFKLYPELSENHRRVLGINVAKSYHTIHKESANKISFGEFVVNEYPAEFLPRITKVYNRYIKKYNIPQPVKAEKPKRKRLSATKS